MSQFNLTRAIGLAILSAAVFVFEITLTRIFAIQQFHHFAFVVVSLAVLGFAVSGVLLSLRSLRINLAWICAGFSLWILLAYLTINLLPFDSYSIAWDQKQIWILLLYFTVAGLPFLFAGWVIGAALTLTGVKAYQPYAANLFGSSLGCILALFLLETLGGERTVLVSAILGTLAGLFFSMRRREVLMLACGLILITICTYWMPQAFQLKLSPYKPLSIVQLTPDAKHTDTQWSASARIDIVETDSVHVFPGLSLNAGLLPPKQIALFIDGDGPIPITSLSADDPVAQQLAEHMPSGLAYRLRPDAKILILQPGGGLEAILALNSSAEEVTLTNDEPLLLKLLENEYLDFSQSLLNEPRIRRSHRASRGTLEVAEQPYDIVTYALTDAFRPVTSGAFSLTENYLLTVESFSSAIDLLTADGLLVITRWLGTPPAETPRTWATLIMALNHSGIEDPSSHLIAYRGMRTGTIIVSKSPFSSSELKITRDFLRMNAYDPIFLPDLEDTELNQYNQLPEDFYHEIYQNLLVDFDSVLSNYFYDISPPTDDHPFFFHFFRWSQTREVIASLGLIWQPFGGSGYLVLLALLGLMTVIAIPLAIAPLFLLGRDRSSFSSLGLRIPLFFAFLGAGYLLVEIPLIQKFTLLLDRPSIALASVLFSLLLTSGIGSLFSTRIPLKLALILLFGYLIVLIFILPPLISLALPWNETSRFLLASAVIAPAGFFMGIPFVSGLRILERYSTGFIPWAWSINGAISGITGVIAAIVGLEWGLSTTLMLGACVYILALFSSPNHLLQKET